RGRAYAARSRPYRASSYKCAAPPIPSPARARPKRGLDAIVRSCRLPAAKLGFADLASCGAWKGRHELNVLGNLVAGQARLAMGLYLHGREIDVARRYHECFDTLTEQLVVHSNDRHFLDARQ